MSVKWVFEDVYGTGPAPHAYTWTVNPNDGGSPTIEKNMNILMNVGPNRKSLVQEGQSSVPMIEFAGVIITQEQYEAMEMWFDRRILIKLTDDLGRQFFGIFSKWAPKRVRKAGNFWYHTYDASFHIMEYINASGQVVYGRTI